MVGSSHNFTACIPQFIAMTDSRLYSFYLGSHYPDSEYRISFCPRKMLPFRLVLSGFAIMMSTLTLASEFEIARLAVEMQTSAQGFSEQIANNAEFTKLKLQSDRLRREAAKLAESISRGHSQAAVFSQFDTVFRRFISLETTFLRAKLAAQDQHLLDSIRVVSSLYAELSYEVYYSGLDSNVSEIYFLNPPFVTRHSTQPYYFPRDRLGISLEVQ